MQSLLTARETKLPGGDGVWSRPDGERGAEAEFFAELFGLSLGDALQNCGGKDTFILAAGAFADAIEEKSADWHNYTILVHALKGSARLIGATELSAQAARLE